MGLKALFIEVTQHRVRWRKDGQNSGAGSDCYIIADRVFAEILEVISRHLALQQARAKAIEVPKSLDGADLYRACRSALGRLKRGHRNESIAILAKALKRKA